MYKKIAAILLFSLFIIGAASAAHEFILNDGFEAVSEYYSINEESGMQISTWDYDDEMIRESYLQNDTGYCIMLGDNNTYNVTYSSEGIANTAVSYLNSGNATLDHGIIEIVEIDGKKYIIYANLEEGTADDWKKCYDEIMKFNENNNIEPLADAI